MNLFIAFTSLGLIKMLLIPAGTVLFLAALIGMLYKRYKRLIFKPSLLAIYLLVFINSILIVISGHKLFLANKNKSYLPTAQMKLKTMVDQQQQTIDSLSTEIATLRNQLLIKEAVPTTDSLALSLFSIKLTSIEGKLAVHDQALIRVENLVLEQPQNLLTLPLIQQRLIGIEKDIEQLDKNNTILYSQFADLTWKKQSFWINILIAIFTLVAGFFSGQFVQKRKQKKEQAPNVDAAK